MNDIDPMVPKHEIRLATNLSDATIWREQRAGRFPPFEKISERRRGLKKSVFQQWLNGRRDWTGEAA